MSFLDLLTETANHHHFPVSGALDLDSVLAPSGELSHHVRRFDSWLAQDFSGEMAYLKRGRDRRADPRLLFPEAKSIFCVAVPYERNGIGESGNVRYARYLKGQDYHDVISARLEKMMLDLSSKVESLKWKVCVDTSAVLERSWAALAGLGWIGKNTTLIHPKLGSYLFLGEVLINQTVNKGPSPIPNYCGQCTRCLTACPTSAFQKTGVLDSRRCISYWTLEKRGPLELSSDDRKAMGAWVAGCDICQEVCPFNIKPSREPVLGIDPAGPYKDLDAVEAKDWVTLLQETEAEYAGRVSESALNRVKPAQFSRNLAIALANQAETLGAKAVHDLLPLAEFRLSRAEAEVAKEWERTIQILRSLL